MTIVRTIANVTISLTNDQANALDAIANAKAGFVGIKAYKATTGMVTPKVSNVTLNIKPKYETIKASRLRDLEAITIEDLDLRDWIPPQGISPATAEEQFAQVYAEELAKARGETRGSASHAKAHDDHSISYEGAKIWLEAPNADGVRPVKSINIFALPVQEKVIDKGVRKPAPKSGSKVLMRKAIHRLWNKRSCSIKTYTIGSADKHGEIKGMSVVMGD